MACEGDEHLTPEERLKRKGKGEESGEKKARAARKGKESETLLELTPGDHHGESQHGAESGDIREPQELVLLRSSR